MSSVTNINAWMKHLEKASRDAYQTNLANVAQVLRKAPELSGKLGLNQLTHDLTVMGKLPWD